MERFEAQKMSQYELELKLDRMTQRAFGDKAQKPPKKPLSVVDAEVIKEYQKQFNEPVREYEVEIDEETGEERPKLDLEGNPIYKVITKKFRVVPAPELDVAEGLTEIPSAEEVNRAKLQIENLMKELKQKEENLKKMLILRKQEIKFIDELPIPSAIITQELANGRFVTRPNPELKLQREQVEEEKQIRLEKIQEIDMNIEELKFQINKMKDVYDNFNIELARLPVLTRENEAKISSVKKINQERVKNYQETLNLMNRGAFQQDKMPNETDEDYVTRLQANAEQEYTDETLFEADMEIKRKFKEALKKLIRDDVKIEQVANNIRTNELGIKTDILKRFPLFKKKFLDLYGLNNSVLTATDITNFIKAFTSALKGDDSLLEYLETSEKENPEYTLELAEKDKSKVLIMNNPANNRNLYWRLAQYFEDDGSEALVALYSLTGKRESYKEYSPKDDNKRIKDETGFTAAYIKKYFDNKPIPVMLVNRIEPSGEYDIDFPISKEPTDIESEYKIGWGVPLVEEIPEMVQFGKIKIALNKLFYKNILSARHNNLGRISGLQNAKVSDEFVDIIMKLVRGSKVLKQEIDALQKSEQMLYDNLLSLANLHKNIPNNKDKTIVALKERLDLIGGSMDAGNDNKALVKEAYNIVKALKNFNVISNKEATKYLSQF